MDFKNIPHELRTFNSWVVWRYEELLDGKPTKVPYNPITGRHADSTNPSTWASFDQAVNCFHASNFYAGVGFVLSEADPYTFIDLDDPYELKTDGSYKHQNPDEIMNKQREVYNNFPSYSELSPSGKGLHIIVRGQIPSGRRRSGIEIYSSSRFMTMTGDVYNGQFIQDCNTQAYALWEQLGKGKSAEVFYAGLEQAKLPDDKILEIACNAANGEKFKDLFYDGNWQKYYPSQSEADFALFDIIAFYSENGFQTKRIFLNSALAQREKSRADYRIAYMLNRCFDRMLPPVDIEGLQNKLREILEEKQKQPVSELDQHNLSSEQNSIVTSNSIYSLPPGIVGEIAQFIYAQAPRPVPEIALAGALGLMAGIVGRAYNISGTGLNQYILLLAPTGTGKEAIAGGIDKIMNMVSRSVPASKEFIGASKINSEQALLKYLNKGSNSFVSIVGEFGIRIREMSAHNAAPHMANLLALFLDLFNKSGEGKILRPSIYSDREKNTGDVLSPAASILGESTPEKFYEILNESMVESGLVPRFNIIEYRGKRPDLNENHMYAQPSIELIDRVATVCSCALSLNNQNKVINVKCSPEVEQLFKMFDKHCDMNINSSEREVKRHLWNRTHINAMKLAALVAVGCNPYDPIIDTNIANWAIEIVLSNTKNLLNRFDSGEVGNDSEENRQLVTLCEEIKKYILSPFKDVEKYSGKESLRLHADKIIIYSYLQRKLACVATFRKDRIGASQAIKRALRTLVERGDLQEVGKSTLAKDYNSSALCYMISNPGAFNL